MNNTSEPKTSEESLRAVDKLFTPSSVAIIGASPRHADVLRTAIASGVRTWLVNPYRSSVFDTPCYSDVASLPEVPTAAMLIVGAATIQAAAEHALAAGVQALVIPGLGAEAGSEGRAIASRVCAEAAHYNAAVLGVNCMGYAQPRATSLWLGSLPKEFLPGHVSIISQSGSAAETLVTTGPRVGFRTVISSGSESNRDTADFLAYLANDPATKAIGLFLEAVRRPSAFSKALHLCREAGKPVVCVKVGRSRLASSVALTHTGAMVGSSVAFSAYLRDHGAIEVRDIPELIETLEIFGRRRWPQGRRVAVVSESGGEASLFADLAEEAGLELPALPEATRQTLRHEFPNFANPQNPIDAWAIDKVEVVFPGCFHALAQTNTYDILVAQVDLTRYRSADDNLWCAKIIRALAEAAHEYAIVPVVVSTNCVDPPESLVQLAHETDIALLRGIHTAMLAIAHTANWQTRREQWVQVPSPEPSLPRLEPGVLSEFESANLLSGFGVNFSTYRRAATPLEAGLYACEVGFPVAVKIDGPAHKSDQGGVVLGVTSQERVVEIAERMGGRVLVSRQVSAGFEVMFGMQRDPDFGAILTVGLGGYAAEAIGSVATALAPISNEAARDFVSAVPGLRGRCSPRVLAGLLSVVHAVSTLAVAHPEIASIDINPVIIVGDEVLAVDALVVVDAAATAHDGTASD